MGLLAPGHAPPRDGAMVDRAGATPPAAAGIVAAAAAGRRGQ